MKTQHTPDTQGAIISGGQSLWVRGDNEDADLAVDPASPDWEKQVYPTACPDVQASLFAARDAIERFLDGPLGRRTRKETAP